ncbi:MAG TPA: hypothetical protein VHO06_14600 [Polyangia bacterium]|nr:hypothetical protein [Polyangia bacterium]
MTTLRRRLMKLGLLVGGSALLWSCVAPILSVPPPADIAFTTETITDSTGAQQTEWIATGGQLAQAANALYLIKDEALGQGVITTARNDGSFTAPPMRGNAGDRILINYQTPYGDYSDSICVLLGTGASADPCVE